MIRVYSGNECRAFVAMSTLEALRECECRRLRTGPAEDDELIVVAFNRLDGLLAEGHHR